MAKILIVEDDNLLGISLAATLEAQKHVIELVSDGKEAIERLKLYSYEVVILDWDLPEMSGVEVCSSYRSMQGKTPILMLTGKDQIAEKEEGFASGVDDYLTKPFDTRELVVRVNALLRRPGVYLEETISIREVQISLNKRSATKNGQLLSLTAKEFAVLAFLMKRVDHYFTALDILNEVWSSESESSEQAVQKCIARLRKKINLDGNEPFIVNSPGLGYKVES